MPVTPGLRFAGYAALFDRVDRAGDAFARGAFAGAGPVPLLWQHRGNPVGVIEAIEEDARGLRVAGRVDDPALAALMRAGALGGLSVGYRAVAARQGVWRTIARAVLAEVSVVAQPMQPGARLHIL
ncbi:Peptidase U35 [Sphingomonas sp. EC-HK361]|uniref:HK97 family phage prohead protease n=1 Tax=Sphingomonas sp. EC-HK361 TaxID=2038397 RepID=UPI0012577AC0|nr:HK97 family phage prohead protease [Sphingomonas sp. EC-HK361]VVT00318.1 Peptidase U35 [Sphingomonas sp. EC-HK361]